jgi:CheY-like chemotaxis protein
MKTLPLFYYPSKWLWIDDDATLLNSMAHVFGKQNTVHPFQSPESCLNYLNKYEPLLIQKNFLQSSIDDENYGSLQCTPVDFNITSLVNLANNPERYNEITVMVIDYNMPEMDGFSLAQATRHLPVQKILLTGKAQETQAIDGFNSSLIHRFVQKNEADLFKKLSTYLKELSFRYFQQISLPILSHLEAETQLPLSDPIFIDFFENYCEQHQIKEYYLIDKQGSFLCIDREGNRTSLIVQSNRGIDAWLAIYENENNFPSKKITAVKERKEIPFFGIGIEGWEIDTSECSPYFHSSTVLNGREQYFWARTDLL